MTVLALTVSHRTATLDDLERMVIPRGEASAVLASLRDAPALSQAVLLSTCNRVEVYALASDPGAATGQIMEILETARGLERGWLAVRSHVLLDEHAVRHLFLVASGLDSMVPGEPEVLGQVRAAYREAAAVGAAGTGLRELFGRAADGGERARAAGSLTAPGRSLADAALRAMTAAGGDVAGHEILVVGAGKIASACLRLASAAGAAVSLAGRRPEAVERLASKLGATPCPIGDLPGLLSVVDGAIFATSASSHLLEADTLTDILGARRGRPLLIVDLGLPRNVDPAAERLEGEPNAALRLYDLARLDRDGYTRLPNHRKDLARAHDTAMTAADRCVGWIRSRPADSFAAAVHSFAERVASAEAARVLGKLTGLDDRQREAVELAIRRSARKLVHVPTARAREAAARGDAGTLDAARWLFGLDGDAEPAVDAFAGPAPDGFAEPAAAGGFEVDGRAWPSIAMDRVVTA